MRVGIVFLSFGKDIFAGIEASLYNLALGLIANQCTVHVYSGHLSGSQNEIDGIEIFRSELLPHQIPHGDDTVRDVLTRHSRRIRSELATFYRSRNLDWLFVCDPLWGVVLLTEAWRTIDCPLLLSLRVLNTPDLLRRAAQAPFWLYTAVSDSLRRDVRQHEDLKPFEVLPNSVDSQRNQPAELPEGGTIVFCNARISPEKGVLDLVQSFPAVMRTVAKAELWLCGGDSPFGAPSAYRQRVLQAIDDLGIGHCVRILPKLRWDEIPATIHAARVVVLPSHAETFGRAALEAMACGRPLVVTNVGNLPWLVQDAGKVVDAGDPVQLAAAITASLLDDEQARRMRLLGIARAADFTNERVAARLLELLQSRARGDA